MEYQHSAVAILPSSNLDQSQAFFEKLGFSPTSVFDSFGYRILHDQNGASVHLTQVDAEWLDPRRNAHGLYLYSKDVDALAARAGCLAETKPWGMREFAISDPDGTLIRVGWPV